MDLCIFGAGGFAKEAAAIAKRNGDWVLKFISLDAKSNESYMGISIISEDHLWLKNNSPVNAVIAVSKPEIKERIYNKIIDRWPNINFPNLIDNTVVFADMETNKLGEGIIIQPRAFIAIGVSLGNFIHLNYGCCIGHDAIINDFCSISPNACTNGNTSLGKRVYLGTLAGVRENIKICDDVTIGMNSAVIKNITEPGIYGGVPAKKIK